MSSLVAGSAYVEVEPSFKGFVRRTASESNRAAALSANKFNQGFSNGVVKKPGLFRRVGSGVAHAIGTTLKVGSIAVGTVAGAALVGGFKSAIDQQNAQKVLSGLYGSLGQAKSMMKSLHKVSEDSALNYTSYLKGAESLAYAGVKGKQATGILRNVGKAISAAGGSDENLNRATDAILKMVNAGKVQLDTLQQLSDAGVPILSGLAKHFGVSIAQVNKMASEGKIKLDDVMSVMQHGTGKTFQQMIKAGNKADKSFSNVWKRIKDNVTSSIGAAMIPLLNKAAPLLEKVGNAVNKWLNKQLKKLPGIINNLSNDWREFKQGFAVDLSKEGSKWQRFGSLVKKVFNFFTGKGDTKGAIAGWGKKIKTIFKNIDIQSISNALKGFGESAPVFNAGFKVMGMALGFIADHSKTIAKWIPAIVAGYLAWKAASSFLGPNSLIGYTARTAAIIAQTIATNRATAAANANALATGQQTAAQNTGIIAWVRNTAAAVAHRVATIAGSAAARAYAAAQWLVNAAMNANPISLIIIGLVALGAAFVVLWKKSETFRKIVKGAWEGIKKAALAVFHWFTKTLWPGMKKFFGWMTSGFNGVKNAFSTGWKKIKGFFSGAWNWVKGFFKKHWMTLASILLGPVAIAAVQIYKHWDKIKGYFKKAWNWVKGTFKKLWNGVKGILHDPVNWAKNKIGNAWGNIKDAFRGAWNWMKRTFKGLWHGVEDILMSPINWVKKGLNREVRGWKKIFRGAKTAIGKIWDGLKGIVKSPVNWVIKHVINHPLISGINALLPGNPISPLKGFDRGGWTGPGAKMKPAGVVHADEFVVKKSSRQRIESKAPGLLDYMNQTGRIPGFAGGGRVPFLPKSGMDRRMAWSGIEWYRPWLRKRLVSTLRSLQKRGWSVLEMMPFDHVDPVHSAHSLHYLPSRGHGNAADISRPGMRGADRVARTLEAMGFGVKWRAPGHFNHIHVDTSLLSNLGHGLQKNKGGSGGFFGGIFDSIKNKLKGLYSKVLGKFKGNKFAQIPVELTKKAASGLWDWAKEKLNPFNWFGGAEGHGKLGGNVAAKLKVKSAAAMYGWDHGYMWDAIKHIVRNESSWNPHARNPSSGAYGLFQALPPSKMNSIARDWRTNADTQARWGMKYIAQRYGNPARAWDFWTKHHWYADGGRVTEPVHHAGVFDRGGWLRPGLNVVDNRLGRPEHLVRADGPGMGAGVRIGQLSVTIPMEDVAQLRDMEEFLQMIERSRVDTRMTERSGRVPS